jgi:hypothetical protein
VSSAESAPRPAEDTVMAPTVVTPSAPAERARVIVRATPSHAHVTIDAQGTAENPWAGFLPKDGATHSAHVEADGYAPHDESFTVTGDTTLMIFLEPRKAAARAPAAARSAAPPPVTAPIALSAPPPPPPAHAEPAPAPAPAAAGGVPLRRINQSNPYAH